MTTNLDNVLAAIIEYWRENAIPPTIREIQALTGISSTAVVRYYYCKLSKNGAIIRIKGKPVPIQIYREITGEPSQ